MGSKQKPGAFDCYANALPDEPMFILLARDPIAPTVVRQWAKHREKQIRDGMKPRSDHRLVFEAKQCATAMEQWRRENYGKWRKEPTHAD